MKERRALVQGLRPEPAVDRSVEEHFIHTGKPKSEPSKQHQDPKQSAETREGKGQAGDAIGRAPLTTRVRADFAAALKRASLQRQLDGVRPNTLQDILEEALEPWLRYNGYLS
jgi:cell pole-organizing protein PopZ